MKVVTGSEAKEDLRNLDEGLRRQISNAIEDLKQNPLPDNSYVIHLLDGSEVQCLKLQEEDRNSELNHRVTYDIVNDEFIRIYGIFERNPGYENIKKEKERRM